MFDYCLVGDRGNFLYRAMDFESIKSTIFSNKQGPIHGNHPCVRVPISNQKGDILHLSFSQLGSFPHKCHLFCISSNYGQIILNLIVAHHDVLHFLLRIIHFGLFIIKLPDFSLMPILVPEHTCPMLCTEVFQQLQVMEGFRACCHGSVEELFWGALFGVLLFYRCDALVLGF